MASVRSMGTWVGRLMAVGVAISALGTGGSAVHAAAAAAPVVVYRVNAGGPALSGTPGWTADTTAAPSPYVNAAATGNTIYSTTTAIDMSDASIPAGTPAALFQSERWDGPSVPEMQWNFSVTPGAYAVRLYFAELYSSAQTVGGPVFHVAIEGNPVLTNFDVYAAVGANKALMKSFQVT